MEVIPAEELLRPVVLKLPDSATLTTNRITQILRSQGKKIYALGFGQSAFPPPSHLQERLGKYAYKCEYGPSTGFAEVRETIAAWFDRRLKTHITEANILCAPGVKLIIHHLACAFSGDILIPAPAWASYNPIARLTEHDHYAVATSFEKRWRTTPESLEETAKQSSSKHKLLILNYPDALGLTYTAEELQAIAKVCRKYNIIVLADEIYSEYVWGSEYISMHHFYPEGTIILEGMSKWCGAGGWRFGVAMFPNELRELRQAIAKMGTQTYSLACGPVQWACKAAFEDSPQMREYIQHTRRIMQFASIGVYKALTTKDSKILVHEPTGSFYLFIDMRQYESSFHALGIRTSSHLRNVILREIGVALLPSSSMGMDPKLLSFRLAAVDFDGAAAFEESLAIPLDEELPDSFLEKHLSHMFKGCRVLVNWCNAPTLSDPDG